VPSMAAVRSRGHHEERSGGSSWGVLLFFVLVMVVTLGMLWGWVSSGLGTLVRGFVGAADPAEGRGALFSVSWRPAFGAAFSRVVRVSFSVRCPVWASWARLTAALLRVSLRVPSVAVATR